MSLDRQILMLSVPSSALRLPSSFFRRELDTSSRLDAALDTGRPIAKHAATLQAPYWVDTDADGSLSLILSLDRQIDRDVCMHTASTDVPPCWTKERKGCGRV